MQEDQAVLQLWRACYAGNTDLVTELLEEDVDYAQTDRNGETVLHMAARSDNADVLNLLLDHLDPDVCNNNQQTPLHLSASKGHIDCVNTLLQADCNPEVRTKYSGMTALHLACQNNRTQVVSALLESGAVCNTADTISRTPDFYATDPEIHKIFLEHAKHCTHRQRFDSPPAYGHTSKKSSGTVGMGGDKETTENFATEHDDEDSENSDTEDENSDKKRTSHKKNSSTSRTKNMWTSAVRSQKKIKVNHGLGFSEEHKRRMEMNVFDRLMGNKKK